MARVENKKWYHLTHSQKQIWNNEKMNPNSSLYNLGGCISYIGETDIGLLEKSIRIFIEYYEGLHFRFTELNEIPFQYVDINTPNIMPVIDFTKHPDPDDQLEIWMNQQAQIPFILNKGCLFEFILYRCSDKKIGFFVKLHHLIADGWSFEIMTVEIRDIYMQLLADKFKSYEGQSTHLEDFLQAEEEYRLLSSRFKRDQEYWYQTLKDLPEPILGMNSSDLIGKRLRKELTQEQTSAIRMMLNQHNLSMNDFATALVAVIMHKHYIRNDIIVSMPIINRTGKAQKRSFGMFTNTIPVRIRISAEQTMLDVLKGCRASVKHGLHHRRYPYNEILQADPYYGINFPLFEVGVNCYSTSLANHAGDLLIENQQFHSSQQLVPIQFIVKEWDEKGQLTVEIDYRPSLFPEWLIMQFADYIDTLVDFIGISISTPLRELRIASASMLDSILHVYNDTAVEFPRNQTIHNLIEEQAARTPDQIAIIDGDRIWTYRQLVEQSQFIADYLVGEGIQRNQVIGLSIPRSGECLLAMLAILKAGGAFLPIEPDTPANRIQYILDDSNAVMYVTQGQSLANISPNTRVIDIKSFRNQSKSSTRSNLSNSDDLAYVIYTSGTTGNPKGVAVQHRALVNYITFASRTYVVEDSPVFALYSTIAFDLTITSLFTPLVCGGAIAVYGDTGENALLDAYKDGRASVIKVTPAHLSILERMPKNEKFLRAVKVIIVGGEALKTSLAAKISEMFDDRIQIFNEYGPTETVVGCMIHRYDKKRDTDVTVPIGRPIYNAKIYVLDDNHDPVPIGVEGEIYISGECVARGYMNNLELTSEKFITNPFVANMQMYRTGDKGLFSPSLILEYRGRNDEQVKIRGYRIEPLEIESSLLTFDEIDSVTVQPIQIQGTAMLCAYVVKNKYISNQTIHQRLRRNLPAYMQPTFILELDQIPVNRNGKVDKRVLPLPTEEQMISTSYSDLSETAKDVLEIVKELFINEQIALNSNFYMLGGDSIQAIQLSSRLLDKGIKLSIKDILATPILGEMIERADPLLPNKQQKHVQISGTIQRMPIINWFLEQRLANESFYFMNIGIEILHPIDLKTVNGLLRELLLHHDELRLNWDSSEKCLFYNDSHFQCEQLLEEFDLTDISQERHYEKIYSILNDKMSTIHLSCDLLFQGVLFRMAADRSILILLAHHLIIDGVSWRILLDDLHALFSSYDRGSLDDLTLPVNSDPLQSWADALACYEPSNDERDYWQQVIQQLNNASDLECLRGVKPVLLNAQQTVYRELTVQQTLAITREAARMLNVGADCILLAIFANVLGEYQHGRELWIMLESHGRYGGLKELNVSRTIGWFTTLYPLKVRTDLTVEDSIRNVKSRMSSVPNHGLGYGTGEMFAKRAPQLMFNYMGAFEANNDYFSLIPEYCQKSSSPDNMLTALLEANLLIVDGKLRIGLTYDCLDTADVMQMLDKYEVALQMFAHQYEAIWNDVIQSATLSSEDIAILFD